MGPALVPNTLSLLFSKYGEMKTPAAFKEYMKLVRDKSHKSASPPSSDTEPDHCTDPSSRQVSSSPRAALRPRDQVNSTMAVQPRPRGISMVSCPSSSKVNPSSSQSVEQKLRPPTVAENPWHDREGIEGPPAGAFKTKSGKDCEYAPACAKTCCSRTSSWAKNDCTAPLQFHSPYLDALADCWNDCWPLLEPFFVKGQCGAMQLAKGLLDYFEIFGLIFGMDLALHDTFNGHPDHKEDEKSPNLAGVQDDPWGGDVRRKRAYFNRVIRLTQGDETPKPNFLRAVAAFMEALQDFGWKLVEALRGDGSDKKLLAHIVALTHLCIIRICLLHKLQVQTGIELDYFALDTDHASHGIHAVTNIMTWMATALSAPEAPKPARSVLLPIFESLNAEIAEECRQLQLTFRLIPCRYHCLSCKICAEGCCGARKFLGEMASHLETVRRETMETRNPVRYKNMCRIVLINSLVLVKYQLALYEEIEVGRKRDPGAYHKMLKERASFATAKRKDLSTGLAMILDDSMYGKQKRKKDEHLDELRDLLFLDSCVIDGFLTTADT